MENIISNCKNKGGCYKTLIIKIMVMLKTIIEDVSIDNEYEF